MGFRGSGIPKRALAPLGCILCYDSPNRSGEFGGTLALYSFSAQLIGGHQRLQSCVAAAAYRAGERLHDEFIGRAHDYRDKRVELSEILVPDGAPEWARDRETLWNLSELCKTRVKGVTARELRFALPRELDREQQRELVRTFLQEEFVALGMVADWSLHDEPGRNQPHVHVMLTVRELQPDGFGKRVFEWDKKRMLYRWREAWALHANRALELAGREERIDHRSYADRGINLEPQPKLYRRAGEVEQRDGREVVRERMRDLLRVQRENGERIKHDPAIPLRMLTEQRATFSRDDLLKVLNTHTADAQQFDECLQAVMHSPELVELPDGRFTSREMLRAEQRVLGFAQQLRASSMHEVAEHYVREVVAKRSTLSEEQRRALEHLTGAPGLVLLEGYAGTGKSFLLGAAREAWEAQGLMVLGGALAGKAADGLALSSGIESRTLASWERAWSTGREQLTDKHVLVVDEAGMLGTRQLGRVLEKARQAGAKVVLVGDSRQLQAIEAGSPFRVLVERIGSQALTEVRRQDIAWQRDATKAFASGNAKSALAAYQEHKLVKAELTSEGARQALVSSWTAGLDTTPIHEQLILAYRRSDVDDLNVRAREIWRTKGSLGQEHEVVTEYGKRAFAVGDRIYIGKNDRGLDVKRGMLGTLERIEGEKLTVRLDGQERRVTFDLNAYAHLDYGYAVTVHKSQGATVDRTYVLASKLFDASTSYVAMSRHRKHVELYWARDEFGTRATLERILCRERPKELALEVAERDVLERANLSLQEALRDESYFALLSPDAQRQMLKRYERAYEKLQRERPIVSAEQVFQNLPELKDARAAEQKAREHVTRAQAELDRYRRLTWFEKLTADGSEQAFEQQVEKARHEFGEAHRKLSRLDTDFELRERARTIASENNRAVVEHSKRLTKWREQVVDVEREGLLEHAFETIREKYAGELRHRNEGDLNRPLKVLATAKLGVLNNGKELHCALFVADDGARVLQPLEAYQAESLRSHVGQKVEIAQNALGRVELNLSGPGFGWER